MFHKYEIDTNYGGFGRVSHGYLVKVIWILITQKKYKTIRISPVLK
jgi:hypothetical protein